MPATTGMKGGGYYDQHSAAQMSSIQALQDWGEDAVAGLPLPDPGQPVTVLDLGSSGGGNAIRGMGTIVAGLRRRTDQPLQTIYSDLATYLPPKAGSGVISQAILYIPRFGPGSGCRSRTS